MEITIKIRKFAQFGVLIILIMGNIAPSIGIEKVGIQTTPSSPSNVDVLESQITITNVDDDEYLNGLNMFGLVQSEAGDPFNIEDSYLVLTTMEGKIVKSPLHDDTGQSFSEITWINDTTILTDYKGQPLFWNVVTNATQQFNFAENLHDDLKYNPNSKSFFLIERFVKELENSTGGFEDMVVDRLREYSLRGEVLWSWDLSEYVNTSTYFDNFEKLNPPINQTIINTTYNATTNTTITTTQYITINATLDKINFNGINYTDPIHANSIYWDTENRFVYVNLQNLNQIIKFNYFNKEPEWVAGQDADFKLLKANGTESESLWYHSHDLNYLGNNEFLMFDNDYYNVTDPMGNFTQSSIVKFKFDNVNMTIKETFRWLGAKSYSGELGGAARKLSNGNYLATFGSPIHGNLSSPSHTSFGGAAIEINPTGEKVWELRVPFESGFSRLHRYVPITTVSPAATVAVDVGTDIRFRWDDAFSNFPKSYNVSIEAGIDLDSGDWNNDVISYTLDTSNLAQGDHIVTLTLTDLADNEKAVATKVTILLLEPSKKDDSPFLTYFVFLNSILIMLFFNKKRSNKNI